MDRFVTNSKEVKETMTKGYLVLGQMDFRNSMTWNITNDILGHDEGATFENNKLPALRNLMLRRVSCRVGRYNGEALRCLLTILRTYRYLSSLHLSTNCQFCRRYVSFSLTYHILIASERAGVKHHCSDEMCVTNHANATPVNKIN